MPSCYRMSPKKYVELDRPANYNDGTNESSPVSVDSRETDVTYEDTCTGEYLRRKE